MNKIEKILAEIDRRIQANKTKNGFPAGTLCAARIEAYAELYSFIDSLPEEPDKILDEAVEGRIHAIGFHNAIYIKEPEWTEKLDKYGDGEKVRVIVLPMEEPNNG